MLYRGNYFMNGLFNDLYRRIFVVAVVLFVPQKKISPKRFDPKPLK